MQGLANTKTNTRATPRSSWLSRVESGTIERPFRILLYGAEKIGKSTFAAQAPKPIFLCLDRGTDHMNVKRFPIPKDGITFDEVRECLRELATPGHGFETLVIDPINFLEPIVHVSVTGSPDIPIDALKGNANGYVAMKNKFESLKKDIEQVWLSGVNVLLLGHAEAKRHDPPDGESFERYTLAMNEKCGGIFLKWVDNILFARRDSFGKVDPKTKRIKAAGTGAVYLYARETPAFFAGNRAQLPPSMPFSWNEFYPVFTSGTAEHARLVAQIEEDIEALADPKLEAKVRTYLEDPKYDVADIANQLRARVERARHARAKETEEEYETEPTEDEETEST